MKSFRTEIENPIVEKDILDLEQKIHDFHNNNIDEEKFRSLRLARRRTNDSHQTPIREIYSPTTPSYGRSFR
jgi:hypothetical protein